MQSTGTEGMDISMVACGIMENANRDDSNISSSHFQLKCTEILGHCIPWGAVVLTLKDTLTGVALVLVPSSSVPFRKPNTILSRHFPGMSSDH